MQKARRHITCRPEGRHGQLRPLVGTRFQVLLTPRLGCFSPFPHGTSALSVTREYLALDSGLPGFPQGFTCPEVLGNVVEEVLSISPTGLSPSVADLSSSNSALRRDVQLY